MQGESISIEIIAQVVNSSGSSAVIDGEDIVITPSGGAPHVYTATGGSLFRRLVIQIGKRCKIPSDHFWHPELARESTPSGVVVAFPPDQKNATGSDDDR